MLEINGVQAFNFASAKQANELFDTVCMVFLPKEELMRKTNGKKKYHDDDSTSSEEETASRRGRRSVYEEEARKAGAERISSRNLGETRRKQKEEEADLRQIEREIRQLERADRERQADQERRRSQVLASALPNGTKLTAAGRPSILFSPPQTSNKSILRTNIMQSIQKSPSTSDRKRSQIRNAISVPSTPSNADQPKKTKKPSSEPKKTKEPKTKERKPAGASPAPASSKPTEVPKQKSRPRDAVTMSPNPNLGAPKMPKRRSSVMVERKVRELERATRERNGGGLSPAPLSPEETMKPKVKTTPGKPTRKLSKGGGGSSSKKLSKQPSSRNKS